MISPYLVSILYNRGSANKNERSSCVWGGAEGGVRTHTSFFPSQDYLKLPICVTTIKAYHNCYVNFRTMGVS